MSRTGTEGAVLGLEAAQQAWEAYRGECQTQAVPSHASNQHDLPIVSIRASARQP